MEIGYKTKCYPTKEQKKLLSQWIGHQRFIKNAKIGEWNYFNSFAKFNGIRVQPDQQYSQFITEETSFLKEVPSQILRNGAYLWMRTMQKAFKGECGFPIFRSKNKKESVLITNELFDFKTNENKSITLTIGTKKHPVGILIFNKNKEFKTPKSIVITKEKDGSWSLSFCYVADDIKTPDLELELVENLDLNKIVKGFDRGVKIPVAGSEENFEFSEKEKRRLKKLEQNKKRYQRQFSKKVKGSKNKEKARKKLAKVSKKIFNIKHDFAHKTSYKIAISEAKVIVFENLKLKNMTKSSKGTKEKPGKNIRQKAGLNRALLGCVLGKIKIFTEYKLKKRYKHLLLLSPYQTSQECAYCGHIHPDNRKSQSEFFCISCGHHDNADRNAAKVLENRAKKLILDLGTGLTLSATMDVIASGEGSKTLGRLKSSSKKQSSKISSSGEGMTNNFSDTQS